MNVQTNHQIMAFGADRMMTFDSSAGSIVVDANRNSEGTWTVHAEGVEDVTTGSRADAISAMIAQALAALPEGGYSTLVPHGLAEMP